MERNRGAWKYRNFRELMGNNGAEGNWDQQVGYISKRVNPRLGEHIANRKMNREMCL